MKNGLMARINKCKQLRGLVLNVFCKLFGIVEISRGRTIAESATRKKFFAKIITDLNRAFEEVISQLIDPLTESNVIGIRKNYQSFWKLKIKRPKPAANEKPIGKRSRSGKNAPRTNPTTDTAWTYPFIPSDEQIRGAMIDFKSEKMTKANIDAVVDKIRGMFQQPPNVQINYVDASALQEGNPAIPTSPVTVFLSTNEQNVRFAHRNAKNPSPAHLSVDSDLEPYQVNNMDTSLLKEFLTPLPTYVQVFDQNAQNPLNSQMQVGSENEEAWNHINELVMDLQRRDAAQNLTECPDDGDFEDDCRADHFFFPSRFP